MRSARAVPSAVAWAALAALLGPCLWLGRAEAVGLAADKREEQLLALLRQEKYIRAREQAELLMRERPGSFIARFTLAHVYEQEEGNLPLALYHARRAEQALQRAGSAEEPMFGHWHRRLLLMQETLLGEMDRREEQLAVLERHDSRYKPHLALRRIWPLMKLHRFEEAAEIAKKATLSDDLETRVSGYNGLLSIEFERERPRECFEVAMRAVRATNEQSCILNLNTSEAAFAVFKFAEAERLALKSLQAPIQDCPDSAHQHLAHLYLLRADFRRAIAAVKEARQRPVPRRLRQQFEMVMTGWLVRLLYALGQFDKSGELASRVLRAPDRVGLVSFSSELMQAIYTIDHYATLEARGERLRERASARAGWAALREWGRAKWLELASWRAGRQASSLIARHGYLESLLTPYLKPLPPWQSPLLVDILGRSVVERLIERLRARAALKRETWPYLRALQVWIWHRAGDHARAFEAGKEALGGLPAEESLLRARLGALVADSARRLRRATEAQGHFDAVLHRWPTALRTERIRLPVRIISGEGGIERAVAARLLDSRRLLVGEGELGFVVEVRQRERVLEMCLSGPRGRRYACAESEARRQPDEDDEQRIARLVDAFHDTVFAPLIDLTQQDISSLDGSAVRARADQVLEEVLGR